MNKLLLLWERYRGRVFPEWLWSVMNGQKPKWVGKFRPGQRVVMGIRGLAAQGGPSRDAARVWTVIECECDLCATKRFVGVDQRVSHYGMRHIACANLCHYGQPMTGENSPKETDAQSAAVSAGIRKGIRKCGPILPRK